MVGRMDTIVFIDLLHALSFCCNLVSVLCEGITMEGLYRVSGKKEVIGELKNKFENGRLSDHSAI